jgi:hypothetical protein
MSSGFYLIVFRRFSASFTGIGSVVDFGGVGRVDSTVDDNFTRVAYIYVDVAPHCSVAVGLQGDVIKYYLFIEFRLSSTLNTNDHRAHRPTYVNSGPPPSPFFPDSVLPV